MAFRASSSLEDSVTKVAQHRRLSECEDEEVQIFDQCIDPDTTYLQVPPASPTPGSARDRTSALRRTARRTWPRPPAGYVRPSAAAWLGSPRYPASNPWISGVIEGQTQ